MTRAAQQARCMEAAFKVAEITRDYRADMSAELREQLDRKWLAAEIDPRWNGATAEIKAQAAKEWKES